MSTRKVTYYIFGSVSNSVSSYVYLPFGVSDPQLIALLRTVVKHELSPVMSIQICDGLRLVDIHLIDRAGVHQFAIAMHSERPFMRTHLVNHWTKFTRYSLHVKIDTKVRSRKTENKTLLYANSC